MNYNLKIQIDAFVDYCSPSCRVRRAFHIEWSQYGLEYAYSTWKARTDLINIFMIPQLDKLIEEALSELGRS